MKLYRFNPNGYGEQAFVVAKSKEDAIIALQDSISEYSGVDNMSGYNCYKKTIEAMVEERGEYTIDEIDPMEVVWSEIA